jgi:hypothetical protein
LRRQSRELVQLFQIIADSDLAATQIAREVSRIPVGRIAKSAAPPVSMSTVSPAVRTMLAVLDDSSC